MGSQEQSLKSDLKLAVNVLLKRQGMEEISPQQYFQLECLILRENSLHQLPTGSGKTWAPIRYLKLPCLQLRIVKFYKDFIF